MQLKAARVAPGDLPSLRGAIRVEPDATRSFALGGRLPPLIAGHETTAGLRPRLAFKPLAQGRAKGSEEGGRLGHRPSSPWLTFLDGGEHNAGFGTGRHLFPYGARGDRVAASLLPEPG